jgi:hypothetical protein
MSHFTVLIMSKEGENPEEQLAPFQENNMSTCPKEYLTFVDVTDESLEEYESGSRSEFYCNSSSSFGQLVNENTFELISALNVGDCVEVDITRNGFGYFQKDCHYECGVSKNNSRPEEYVWVKCIAVTLTDHLDKNVCFEGKIILERVAPPKQIAFKEYYKTFEEFMFDYHGYKGPDEETDRYCYRENKNCKWDWYQLGGRWRGFFKTKKNATGTIGTKSFYDKAPREGYVDQCLRKDIDFEGMKEDSRKESQQEIDGIFEWMDGYMDNLETWNEIRDRFENVDEARAYYKNTPFKKRWDEGANAEKIPYCLMSDPIESYCLKESNPKEAYINKQMKNCFVTFAVIKDGEWYERGDMGWWGITSNEKNEDEWSEQVFRLIVEADDNTMFSMYDCHI